MTVVKEVGQISRKGNQTPSTNTMRSRALPAGEQVNPVEPETPAHVTEVEELFKTLTSASNCRSLLHKHLTPAIFDQIKARKTSFGGTLADCIRAGCLNLDSRIGIVACDPDAYKVFSEILDPVIKDHHRLARRKDIRQPHKDYGGCVKLRLENLDPEAKFIISTRVMVSRSLDGFGFPPVLTSESREDIERKVVDALHELGVALQGTYYPLTGMDAATQARLSQAHLLFADSDRILKAAGGYDDWPTGRGVFVSLDQSLLVWVNEEDHLKLISLQSGGDLETAYKRLVCAIKAMEKKLKVVRDHKLGFLTFCPSNLGTALKATVYLKLPHLAACHSLQSACDNLGLHVQGVDIEDTDKNDVSVYKISSQRCLGLTELQVIQQMYRGVKEIIRQEKEMSWWPENVQDMFEHVSRARHCTSLLKKHLTLDVFQKLKDKTTSHNATLADCIISGAVNLDSEIGLCAADAESYTEFALLFEPIIKDYHKLKAGAAIDHPATDFRDLETLGFSDLDPDGAMVVSTRITVARCLSNVVFAPLLHKEDRAHIEDRLVDAFSSLPDQLRGTYHRLQDMSPEAQQQLAGDRVWYNTTDRFLRTAGVYNDWPAGRGVFFNEDKTFSVWVNGVDHVRVTSVQSGRDVDEVYTRLVAIIACLEDKVTFARDDRLGYLTLCPSHLGTALRACVQVKIPHLSVHKDFTAVCDKLRVQARSIDSEAGVYDISNRRVLGLTEMEAVRETVAGVREILRLEKGAENGKRTSCALL